MVSMIDDSSRLLVLELFVSSWCRFLIVVNMVFEMKIDMVVMND